MIKIIKKLSIAMLTASILFATIGTSAHAASKDNKKIQYYKEYQSIIKKVNTSKNKQLLFHAKFLVNIFMINQENVAYLVL